MLTTMYAMVFSCAAAFSAFVIWRSLAGHAGAIATLREKDHAFAKGRSVVVAIRPVQTFVPAAPPDFTSFTIFDLAAGPALLASRGWTLNEGTANAGIAAGSWVARPGSKRGSKLNGAYPPRTVLARPSYRFQPYVARKPQPRLASAG